MEESRQEPGAGERGRGDPRDAAHTGPAGPLLPRQPDCPGTPPPPMF